MKTQNSFHSSIAKLAAALALALVCGALPAFAANPPAAARSFDTPQQAAEALVKAAEAGDIAAVDAMFGPEGKGIASSGDPVADKNHLAKFAEHARQKMNVTFDVDDPKIAIVVVGNEDWPMPVPIVQKNGQWRYDATKGREELLARRIGGNELDAIALLRGYVDAQKEYAMDLHDGSRLRQYAQHWLSTPGKQDGLSWYVDGKPAGPMGDEIAKALAAGYTKKSEPYNGYYFRTLTAQGPAARLGARDYIVKGAMIGGFAAIAWPANYGVLGVQTFIVNNDGVVYQKDMGDDTAKVAPTIKTFNPDKTWTVTDDAK